MNIELNNKTIENIQGYKTAMTSNKNKRHFVIDNILEKFLIYLYKTYPNLNFLEYKEFFTMIIEKNINKKNKKEDIIRQLTNLFNFIDKNYSLSMNNLNVNMNNLNLNTYVYFEESNIKMLLFFFLNLKFSKILNEINNFKKNYPQKNTSKIINDILLSQFKKTEQSLIQSIVKNKNNNIKTNNLIKKNLENNTKHHLIYGDLINSREYDPIENDPIINNLIKSSVNSILFKNNNE